MLFPRFLILIFLFPLLVFAQPQVQLAKRYDKSVMVGDYLVSEKYDGIRAIWKDGKLTTRNGNPIFAPAWFTKGLPDIWLDGELWSKHNDFEFISSTVSKDIPVDKEWRKVHYMIFDAPDTQHTFAERSMRYTRIVEGLHLAHVKPITQFEVETNEELSSLLDEYVSKGAEGLILHKKAALFESGRTGNLLKLKPYMDAEAKVVAILPGNGKFKGVMGAILVEMPSGFRFKIGTGFSHTERAHPPEIGDIITYKYHGLSANGIPRFASFMRVRYPIKTSP